MLANACGPCIGQWNRLDENSLSLNLIMYNDFEDANKEFDLWLS